MLCFIPANLMASTCTDKNNPFHSVRISILNWKPSAQPSCNRIFSNCHSHNSPAKDRTDFAQEERLDFPYWTMFLALCVVVGESKCLDTPIFEFSIFWSIFHFNLGIRRYCVCCLSIATRQSGNDIHYFCCCHPVMLMILVPGTLHKIQNHLSQYRLGVQPDLCLLGAWPPFRLSSNDRCPSVEAK